MRTQGARVVVLVALVLLGPRFALAQAVYGLRAFGGYSTYAFGDWQDLNQVLFIPPAEAAHPTDGYSLGVGAEVSWRPALSFTFSYERLTPGRMPDVKQYDAGGNTVGSRKLRLPCNALLFEVEYRRRLKPRIRIGAGGGGGYYQLGEEVESPATSRNIEGTSVGGQAFGLGEWEMTPATSIGLDIGYRWAKIDVSNVNSQPPPFAVDSDYSGLQTRIVLRYLPRRGP